MAEGELSLTQLRASLRAHGATRLLVKHLAANDNSKNQIYLGGDLSVINVLPAGDPIASISGRYDTPIFKAALKLEWINEEGHAFPAPSAQLILYPQYPEVRMSGFLRGASWAPRELMASRQPGRILLIAIAPNGRLFAYVATGDSALAKELAATRNPEIVGVFHEYALIADQRATNSRTRLLTALCEITRREWISGWRLTKDGERLPCVAPNCVGVTLESELGITANGRSDPDFEGWEVKCHTVPNLAREGSSALTLLTPEPNGGYYATEGVQRFVQRFGYKDRLGREDRWNFGGLHRVGHFTESTGLKLDLRGYDMDRRELTDASGALVLIDKNENVAASWNFVGLLAHWKRKHSRAAFVPAMKRTQPNIAFKYGSQVLLAEGTDYLRLLAGLADGTVYYDPGIKVENVSTKPKAKKRSQFRVTRGKLATLYHASEKVDCCDAC